jgi:hypothetical protein
VSDHDPNDVDDRRAIARIEQALSELGADHSPPLGWEARVLAASEQPPKPWWQRWQRWLVAGVPCAAAAAAVLFFVLTKQANEGPLQIAVSRTVLEDPCVKADGTTACMSSGGDCSIHQVNMLEATSSAAHRALRLYRGRTLIQSCEAATAGPCEVTKDKLRLPWKVDSLDHYVAVAVSSNEPLPALSGELDADLAKLASAKIATGEKSFHCR